MEQTTNKDVATQVVEPANNNGSYQVVSIEIQHWPMARKADGALIPERVCAQITWDESHPGDEERAIKTFKVFFTTKEIKRGENGALVGFSVFDVYWPTFLEDPEVDSIKYLSDEVNQATGKRVWVNTPIKGAPMVCRLHIAGEGVGVSKEWADNLLEVVAPSGSTYLLNPDYKKGDVAVRFSKRVVRPPRGHFVDVKFHA